MHIGESGIKFTSAILSLLVSAACSGLPDTHQWPRDELFGRNTSQGYVFWPLPPEPTVAAQKAQYELLKTERKNMIETCTIVLEYFRKEKDRAWWKELVIQGSEIGFAAAAIVLAAANPAANAAMIGILGGIGGLGYFTMWPQMDDVVNTENTLLAELRHSRKLYGEAIAADDPQIRMGRIAVDKASNACVLSKMQITVPPPKKPDIQAPPIR